MVETTERLFRVWEAGGRSPVSAAAEEAPAQWEACPAGFYVHAGDSWPGKPASGFESWSLPNIIALIFGGLSIKPC